jgi:hypothetical protein
MFAFVTGNTMDILDCLATHNIIKPVFMMPGCTPIAETLLA